jgi:hypothetical protein
MLKYKTQEDAVLGGYEAQKATGKPFKLPESLDKLDDKSKEEFNTSLNKLRGVPSKIEDLADIKFDAGLPEGHPINEGLKQEFSKFVVDRKMSKSDAQAGVEWLNKMSVNLTKQMKAQEDADYLAQSEATNKELMKPERLGSEANVKVATENIKRMFQNIKGMTAEKFESIGKYLVDTRSVHSADFIEAMATLAAGFEGEGSTHGGEGGKSASKEMTLEERTAKESPATAKALGW